MTHDEFVHWVAYYEIEPFGAERENLQLATIATLIANANRDPKKRTKPFTVKDFMYRIEDKQPGDWQTMKARFAQAAAVANRRRR